MGKSGIEVEYLSGPRDGEVVGFGSDQLEVGRDQGVHLQLSFDRLVSRRHARICRDGDQFTVEDLGSSYGTAVDGKRIVGKASISEVSILAFGHTEVKVRRPSENSEVKYAEAERSAEG
jgi:pSer/pThr/pTyr-binding forkhead associated (FHA) protein